MKTSWTKNLSPEHAALAARDFKESKAFRKRMTELLNEKLRMKHSETRTKEGYANPNWAYFQADAIGYERALTEILSLLED